MRNNLRTVAANLAAFFSPSAFEARARRREQLKLRRELAEVDETIAWCNGRREWAEERLRKLEQQDSAATLATVRAQVTPRPEHFNCRSVPQPIVPPKVWESAGGPVIVMAEGGRADGLTPDEGNRRWMVLELEGLK